MVYPPELEESPPDTGDGNVEGSVGSYNLGASGGCVGLYAIWLDPRRAPESPFVVERRLKRKKARAERAPSPTIPPTTPPAIAPVFDLVLPLPPLAPPEVGEGFGDPPVPEVDTAGFPVPDCDVRVLEMETVGGAVGVASGSLPAACASVASNEGLVSFRYAQCGTDALKGISKGYCVT